MLIMDDTSAVVLTMKARLAVPSSMVSVGVQGFRGLLLKCVTVVCRPILYFCPMSQSHV